MQAQIDTKPEPANKLTRFQRDMLTVIASLDQPHGLKVKEVLGRFYDEEINHGRLYPNLDKLTESGLVEKGALDRRTNYYQITSRGEQMLESDIKWRRGLLDGDL